MPMSSLPMGKAPWGTQMSHTYTYAILEVSPGCYAEISAKLKGAGYDHAFHEDGDRTVIDMHGIALAMPIPEEKPKAPAVDRTARVLTNGQSEADMPDYREIDPATGQQKSYVVLTPEELRCAHG